MERSVVRFAHIRSFSSIALQLAVLAALIVAFFIRTPQVSGLSMEPGIRSGEYVVIDTLSYRFSQPKRGDIVAFMHRGITPEMFIKRVIGLPGDRVTIVRGTVYVNGTRLDEPYVRYHDERSFAPVIVPPDSVYVLGDNRAKSEDSRVFGPVPDSALIGKALAGIWPVHAIGVL
jgi:signal peptidase I